MIIDLYVAGAIVMILDLLGAASYRKCSTEKQKSKGGRQMKTQNLKNV